MSTAISLGYRQSLERQTRDGALRGARTPPHSAPPRGVRSARLADGVRAVELGMDTLILFGVTGLERSRGGSGGLGSVDEGGRRRTVLLSHSITFRDEQGRSITVTSQRPADDEKFASIRDWAPMNTYLGRPEGRDKVEANRENGQPFERVEVDWQPASIPVDGQRIDFEICDFPQGWWAGVGRVSDAVITIDSRGVPVDEVRLERVPEHPVPALPDMGEVGQRVREDLDARLEHLPVSRVRTMSDYWELRSVEVDHVRDLARRYALSEGDRQGVQAHWIARIEAELANTTERLRFEHIDAVRNSRISRRLKDHNLIHQLWWNTLGPGAKTWIGNRLAPIRRFMFRLHWRP
jgi:hypothetical protein